MNRNKFFTALILLSLLSISNLTSASNMLTNAGFESATQDPWWGPWGDDKHTFVYGDKTCAHSGSKSIKITPSSNLGTGQDFYTYSNYQIAVTPGQTFYGYAYAKTVGLANEEVFLVLDWFSNGEWVGATEGDKISGADDWTLLSVQAPAPAGADHVSLTLRIFKLADSASGTVYLDDVYLDTTSLNNQKGKGNLKI